MASEAYDEIKILREDWEVVPRLLELGLTLKGLQRAAAVAHQEGGRATPFHCANAAGTLSYQLGTWALRDEFVGNDWVVDRLNGVEAIHNAGLKLRVAFSNVDLTGVDDHSPLPRSDKGAGAERSCMNNLFGTLPQFAPKATGGERMYYLMVDPAGGAELSLPIVREGTFEICRERIYLGPVGEGDDDGKRLPLDEPDALTDFKIELTRKKP